MRSRHSSVSEDDAVAPLAPTLISKKHSVLEIALLQVVVAANVFAAPAYVTPMDPARKSIGNKIKTRSPLSKAVWMVKLTVTALPVA